MHKSVHVTAALSAVMALAACNRDAPEKVGQNAAVRTSCGSPTAAEPFRPEKGMVFVKGGTFTMGAQPEHREEGPPQKVTVGSFWIDPTEVTNAQFAAFVKATGYVTMAEKPLDPVVYPTVAKEDLAPSSLVFTQPKGQVDLRDPSQWWQVVKGADWRHPAGPGSSIEGKADYPVVQIAYQDALAYAQWAGRDLPTEAEWEFAARGGLEGKRFSWGDSAPDGRSGNMWQGPFPVADEGTDGYRAQLAPVGCFQKNGLGLSDMAGNVWEWTNTWFRPNISSNGGKASIPPESDALDPDEPGVAKHVAKGGSFLCADNYCLRYRPSARTPGPPDTGSSHIGFRTVKRTS